MTKILIFLVGPPGCGKGTQKEKLASFYRQKCMSFEMGKYIRDKRKTDVSFNELCLKHNMDNGGFLPLYVLKEVVEEKINSFMADHSAKFLFLDGYPRTIEQLESLSKFLKETYQDLKVVYFYFRLDEEVCMQRIMDRSASSGRDDDDAKVARERYKKYEEMTLPMIESLDNHFGHDSGRTVLPNMTIQAIFVFIMQVIDYVLFCSTFSGEFADD